MAELTGSPVWQARTGTKAADPMVAFSQSVEEDAQLLAVDLAGSVAHTLGLQAAGLVTQKEAYQLVDGLQTLWQQAQQGAFELDPELEDVHMNTEAALAEEIGPLAAKLHTGRSRNDQVALDLTLITRLGLAELSGDLLAAAQALAEQAKAHVGTPWVAKTHGQPAQPATLGFLLHAHALRFSDLAQEALALFDQLDESPLGSGAVAGSTLPLQPAHTADLLGLTPPRNALLSTSDRTPSLQVCQLVQTIGLTCASLAQELVDLAEAGAISLPSGYTTGSSLMPHKANPDSLELARASGKQMGTPLAELSQVLAGLPLGYHRDLQLAKPPLLEALSAPGPVLGILTDVVQGLTVHPAVLEAQQEAPGIESTDVAEALVAGGMAFRQAYTLVAEAMAQVSQGTPLDEALASQGLDDGQLQAALDVLPLDPAHRATLAGPAPHQVTDQLDQLDQAMAATDAQLDQAKAQARQPLELLTTTPETLVQEDP